MTKTRILIVEDEAVLAEELRHRLEHMGLTVASVASSGEEAVARAGDSAPDLALMDIRLKGAMDGIAAAAVFREQFDIPVVFLTAHADAATIGRAKLAAPVGYLVKPFTPVELAATIEIALHRHASDRMIRQLLETQKAESLARVASGIVHDFSNLMTPIMGNAALAALEVDPESSVGQHIAAIAEAAEKAADLCDEMRAYSGTSVLEMARLDINLAIRQIQGLLRAAVPRRVSLNFELAGDLPCGRGDAGQIQHMLMNMVLNAAEAIADRGSIGIQTRSVRIERPSAGPPPRLADGPYIVIDVTDDGSGMDAETLAQAFEPFFTTKFIGRGLGLAAAQGIARGHHGEITVTSTPGVGSTFMVHLPAVPDPAVPGPA